MSSEDLKANVDFELSPDKFRKGSKEIQKEFDNIEKSGSQAATKTSDSIEKMGTAATQAGDKIERASDEAGTSLDKLGSKAKQAGSKVDAAANTAGVSLELMGDKADQTGNKVAQAGSKGSSSMDQLGSSASGASIDMGNLGIAVLGLSQSIGGLTQQIFDFDSKLIALQKTALGLEAMELALERRAEDLTIALREGSLSALQQKRAFEDLIFAEKQLVLETKNVTAEEKKLSGEYVNFGLNVANTVIFSTIAMKIAFQGLTKAQITNKVATIANTLHLNTQSLSKIKATFLTTTFAGSTVGATLAQGGFTSSLIASIAGIRGLTIAMLSSPMAPFAIAAIGVGAAFLEMERDNSVLRKGLSDLSGREIPKLSEAFGGLSDEVLPEASASMESLTLSFEQSSMAGNELIPVLGTIETGLEGGIIGVGNAANSAAISMNHFSGMVFDAKGNMVDLSGFFKEQTSLLFEWQDALRGGLTMLGEIKKKRDEIGLSNRTGNLGISFRDDIESIRSQANLGSVLSDAGGFFITDDGRAINIGNTGTNIFGSLQDLSVGSRARSVSAFSLGARGQRSFTSRGRNRNPLGRHDKISVILKAAWRKTLGDRASSFRDDNGRLVTLSWTAAARLMGFSIPRPPTARTFGNNDPRSFGERRKLIIQRFTIHAANILGTIGSRISDAQFLHDISPEDFTIREALLLSGRGLSRHQTTQGTDRGSTAAQVEIQKVIDEINAGRPILGLEDTLEDIARIARLESFLESTRDTNGLSTKSRVARTRTRFAIEQSLRLRGGGSKQFALALAAFRGTEKFDFRNQIRLNLRVDRTGTRQPIETTENFLSRLSGLNVFRQQETAKLYEDPADLNALVTRERPSPFSMEEQLYANLN